MWKLIIFLLLMGSYIAYSGMVYTKGTSSSLEFSATEQACIDKGKSIFQQYNCTACHQLYGLGGYLGPELTTAYSDPARGEAYMRAFLQAGGPRMPNYHFSVDEISAIISYLRYVDSSAITYKIKTD
jgi:nitric oxide reductase subunit C